jgi:EmrB/QacA subfamily drug resistance transporter
VGPTDRPSSRLPRSLSLAAVSVGVFLTALDQTMVVTVLPSILRDLRIPVTRLDDAAWVVTGYLLGYTAAMPLFGRIADVRGRRLLYLIGLAVFVGGSVLCVLAGNLSLLVAARIIQAAGGGALVPISMAVAAHLYPPRRLALALGVIGASAEAGAVLGPIYGAYLASVVGWRGIFLVNVPLGVILAVAGWKLIPGDTGEERGGPALDLGGALLLALSLTSLALGLSGHTEAEAPPVDPLWLSVTALSFAAFVWWERGRQGALVNLELFKSRAFTAANLANLAVGAALIVAMVEIPLYAYSLLDMTEVEGGRLLMRLTVFIPVGAVLGGLFADRAGYRLTGILGFAFTAVGYGLVTRWGADPSDWTMTRDLAITGFGFGVVIPPVGATVISSTGPRWMASGAALVTVMRMVGMLIGLATLSSWGLRRFNELAGAASLPLRTPDMSDEEFRAVQDAYQQLLDASLRTVYREFFLVAAVVAATGILAALAFYGRRETRAARHRSGPS